jgi:diadenosine tetraphosphate (Ap4A) HIT family hydrolase
VSRGHRLVIPFRHVPDFFSLTDEEKSAIMTLNSECKMIIEENSKPAGYPVGSNVGYAAGQTVFFGTAGNCLFMA